MSKALEIAEARLAKGEITQEEFEKLKDLISPQLAPAPSDVPAGGRVPAGRIVLGSLFLLFAVFGFFVIKSLASSMGLSGGVLYIIYGFFGFIAVVGILQFFPPDD